MEKMIDDYYSNERYTYEIIDNELIIGKKIRAPYFEPTMFQNGRPYEFVEEVVRIPKEVFQECFAKWMKKGEQE